jgi:hypothetical protein
MFILTMDRNKYSIWSKDSLIYVSAQKIKESYVKKLLSDVINLSLCLNNEYHRVVEPIMMHLTV